MNRREMLASSFGVGAGIAADVMMPVKSLAAEAKRILIRNIETFDIQVPQPTNAPAIETFGGETRGRINVTRVETESGVRGYSFLGSAPDMVTEARKVLIGQDLFAVEQHLKRGLLSWTGVEEAIWDAIGRVANQPVSRLLGGAKLTTVPVYCTYVWPGGADQSQILPKDQSKRQCCKAEVHTLTPS